MKRERSPPPVDVERKVAFLRRPSSYPEGTRRVEVIETHLSRVFLTDRHAYKLKKPVRFKLVDLTSLEARRRNCEAEVRLNRRLAADVYLGVVPLGIDERGRLGLGGGGRIVDWLVQMRRLPAHRMLDRLIARKRVARGDLRRVAEKLADFYKELPPLSIPATKYRERFVEEIEETVRELVELSPVPKERIESVAARLLQDLREGASAFDARVGEGRIVEGHGDLRPEHVCLLPTPIVIDCVEFSKKLRTLDPADELSFLSIECLRLGGPAFIEPELFAAYVRATGDEPPEEVVHFYKAARAFVRAQTAIWHLREPKLRDPARWVRRAERYLEVAERLLEDQAAAARR